MNETAEVKIRESLWKVVDLLVPLVDTDIATFLTREGIMDEEDYRKWKEAVRLINRAYAKSFDRDYSKSKGEIRDNVRRASEILNSIKPKKPMPPEMTIRFASVLSSLEEVMKNLQ